jgi:HSP20 family protein
MSRMIRWEPLNEMMSIREMMDRFFNEPMGGMRRWNEGARVPDMDLYQTDDEVVLKATLPGLKPDDINISVTGDVVTLRGTVVEETETKETTYYLRERTSGEFSRSVPLPAPVVADRAKADFENGVLTLTLPKAEEVKPKTITVKAK